MTKAELIAALQAATNIPDDAPVLVEPWPDEQPQPGEGDLHSIGEVQVFEQDGPDGPPFMILRAKIEYLPQETADAS